MTPTRSTVWLGLAAGALMCATAAGQNPLGRVQLDAPFPDLRFRTLDDRTTSLAEFRGRRVLLLVFASW